MILMKTPGLDELWFSSVDLSIPGWGLLQKHVMLTKLNVCLFIIGHLELFQIKT